MAFFSVRMSSFSLKIRAIRPSTVFGTRRRTTLRGEGFAWVPDLGSFFKLLEGSEGCLKTLIIGG